MKMADGTRILRRNRPGVKAKDFSRWPDEPFDEMDSTLAVQQYIQQQIRREPSNIELILTPPDSQDEGVWKYEHLRRACTANINRCGTSISELSQYYAYDKIENNVHFFSDHKRTINIDNNIIKKKLQKISRINRPENGTFKIVFINHKQFCMELNGLAVRLQNECHPETCSQMTATEQWIFLCAAHKTPKECPAIDYTRHTLDGAACLLNSNKYFPSRVSIKESSVAKLGSVCRRVYRIFSHAYFHHRTIFDEFENETSLCRRFTYFVTKYNLMSKDNLIVPIIQNDGTVGGESEA